MIPDSDQPLQAMVLGTPVVKSHNGACVTENITNVTVKFISAEPFNGGSFDGQYFHLGVDKLRDAHYGVHANYDVDLMHRASTVSSFPVSSVKQSLLTLSGWSTVASGKTTLVLSELLRKSLRNSRKESQRM